MVVRPLTQEELADLILSSPETETRNLVRITNSLNLTPYEFLTENAIESSGIVSERPIYAAYLVPRKENYELWTVVNTDVKEQFSLYKYSKRVLYQWLNKYKKIYATMESINIKNIEWTKKLGFKEVNRYGHLTVLKLEV